MNTLTKAILATLAAVATVLGLSSAPAAAATVERSSSCANGLSVEASGYSEGGRIILSLDGTTTTVRFNRGAAASVPIPQGEHRYIWAVYNNATGKWRGDFGRIVCM